MGDAEPTGRDSCRPPKQQRYFDAAEAFQEAQEQLEHLRLGDMHSGRAEDIYQLREELEKWENRFIQEVDDV